jgi:hypothetical protein
MLLSTTFHIELCASLEQGSFGYRLQCRSVLTYTSKYSLLLIGPFSWSCTSIISTWWMSNKMNKIIIGMFVCLWNAYMCGLLRQTKETLSKFLTLPYMHVIVTRSSLTLVYVFCRLDHKKIGRSLIGPDTTKTTSTSGRFSTKTWTTTTSRTRTESTSGTKLGTTKRLVRGLGYSGHTMTTLTLSRPRMRTRRTTTLLV